MSKPHYRLKANGEVVAMDGGTSVRFSDGYGNAISALGSFNAKVGANAYTTNVMAENPALLDAAYDGSTWYSKILEIPADDATREWRSWKGAKDQIEKIEKVEAQFKVISKVREAIIMARHRGGSVIFMGGLPGAYSSELDLDSIGVGGLAFLNVLSRDEINPVGMVRDPYSKHYGQPEKWVLNARDGMSKDIHPSRVVFVPGRKAPGSSRLTGQVWGSPLWSQMSDSIEAADSSAAIVSALLHEAVIDIVQVPNFVTGLASKDAEQLHMARWAMAKRLKSVGNLLLLDKADDWHQKQVTWNGLPEVVQVLLTIMAGAADIPVTRLIGRSASGMNATGEGDLRNHYDNIKAMQVLELGPTLSTLDEVLLRTTFGTTPANLWYLWKPLWQPSDKDMAETDRLEANATAILSKLNLVPKKAMEIVVQNRMIESGRYPGLEDALKEFPEVEEISLEGSNGGDPNSNQANGNASGVENQRANRTSNTLNTVDAAPRSLYVRRDVLNSHEVVAWAKAQGFTDIIPDMHVTIVHSTVALDWFKVGESWQSEMTIAAGGARLVETLGVDSKFYVLLIKSSELEYRNAMMLEAGAVSSHAEYTAHISIQKGGYLDVTKIQPFLGAIHLGPEIFEEVRP